MFRVASALPSASVDESCPVEQTQAAAPADPARPAGEIPRTIQIYRQLAVWLLIGSGSLAVAMALSLRVGVDPQGAFVLDWILTAMLLVSLVWWGRTVLHRIADALGTVAVAALGGMFCGAIAVLELRFHFPIADAQLHAIDLTLGIDSLRLVGWLARLGPQIFEITQPAYDYTLPLFFVSLCLLALLGKRIEAWRAAACFVGTLLTVCIVAAFMPAKGAGVYGTPDLFAQLPNGAMRGFWWHFDNFYSGTAPVLKIRAVDGVISFPSFHTVVGLLVVTMWRWNWPALVLSALWFVCMLPGTLIYGGHYVVDLVGGLAIWWAWFAFTRRLEKPSFGSPASNETPVSAIRSLSGSS